MMKKMMGLFVMAVVMVACSGSLKGLESLSDDKMNPFKCYEEKIISLTLEYMDGDPKSGSGNSKTYKSIWVLKKARISKYEELKKQNETLMSQAQQATEVLQKQLDSLKGKADTANIEKALVGAKAALDKYTQKLAELQTMYDESIKNTDQMESEMKSKKKKNNRNS